MDEIENGNEEIGTALDKLTEDITIITVPNRNKNETSLLKNEEKDYEEFVKMNKDKFNDFRNLVNSEITEQE